MTRSSSHVEIAAIVAAAGLSRRMGEPKQLLPWGDETILGRVLINLAAAGASPVLCVLGHRFQQVKTALLGTPAQIVLNPDYAEGEMLSSYQAGLRELTCLPAPGPIGTLLALGDQPQVDVAVVRKILEQAHRTPHWLVIPSFNRRRGHPIFVPASLWPELLALDHTQTLRDLVRNHEDEIHYVEVDSDVILRDIDTPADYRAATEDNTP